MNENTTRVSSDDLDRLESKTDWDRLEEQTDEDIRNAVREDPDQEILDEEWFRTAQLVTPTAEKKRITIRLDEDVVEFFKSQGEGYQTRVNQVLRAYVLAQKMKGAAGGSPPQG
jgi:uncharacterized protein (DUF4415 family)